MAGIQCNGCQDVTIRNCLVGPTSSEVPALATFAHARFILRFAQDIIPFGFQKENMTDLLDRTTVTIRTKGTRRVTDVFKELQSIVNVFRQYHMNPATQAQNETQMDAYLQTALKIFKYVKHKFHLNRLYLKT